MVGTSTIHGAWVEKGTGGNDDSVGGTGAAGERPLSKG